MGLLDHNKHEPTQPAVVDGAGNAQTVGGHGGARAHLEEIKAREQQMKHDEKVHVTSTFLYNKQEKKEAKKEAKEERKELEHELKEAKKQEKAAKKM